MFDRKLSSNKYKEKLKRYWKVKRKIDRKGYGIRTAKKESEMEYRRQVESFEKGNKEEDEAKMKNVKWQDSE